MRSNINEPHLDLGNPHRIGRRKGLSNQLRTLHVGFQNRVDQRRRAARYFLSHSTDAPVARQRNFTAVDVDLSPQEAKQSRLAGAVAADKSDLVASGNIGRRLLKERPTFDPIGEVADA